MKTVQAQFYTGKSKGKADKWKQTKRMDTKCAPTMPHEYGKPVCDGCYRRMERLLEGRRKRVVCPMFLDPDGSLCVHFHFTPAAFAARSVPVFGAGVPGVVSGGE